MPRAYKVSERHELALREFRAALPVRQVVRADDLAQAQNVTKRTIYRWMDALREQGVKIAGAPGFGYWIHSK